MEQKIKGVYEVMKKMGRKPIAGMLAIAMVLTLVSVNQIVAVAETEAPACTLVAKCHDWGEAIEKVQIDMGKDVAKSSVSTKDFTYTTTVTYYSYVTGQNETEEVTRNIKSYSVDGSMITLHLVTEAADGHKFYADTTANPSISSAKVALVGTVLDTDGKAFEKTDAIACTGVTNKQLDKFQACSSVEGLNYRLFVPENTDEARPLVVWLHGAGETGDDNRLQVGGNYVAGFTTKKAQKYLDNAFVMAPQVSSTTGFGHNPQLIMAAIEEIMAEHKIDTNRIYVGGCSMGGMGTVDMITAYPDFFAAAFPICPASELSDAACAALAEAGKTAVYFVHSLDDGTCNVSSSFNSYGRLIAAYEKLGVSEENAPVHATFFEHVMYDGLLEFLIPYMGHSSWVYVHNNFNCTGNDYDGTYFLDSSVDRPETEDAAYYVKDGKVYYKADASKYFYDYGNGPEEVVDWTPFYTGQADWTKMIVESNYVWVSAPSTNIRKLTDQDGNAYKNFFDWLGDQSR